MTTIPDELVEALAAEPSAADLFASLHRYDRAAKCRWVRAGPKVGDRRQRAVQVLLDLRAHDAARRANLARRGSAAFFTAPHEDQ